MMNLNINTYYMYVADRGFDPGHRHHGPHGLRYHGGEEDNYICYNTYMCIYTYTHIITHIHTVLLHIYCVYKVSCIHIHIIYIYIYICYIYVAAPRNGSNERRQVLFESGVSLPELDANPSESPKRDSLSFDFGAISRGLLPYCPWAPGESPVRYDRGKKYDRAALSMSNVHVSPRLPRTPRNVGETTGADHGAEVPQSQDGRPHVCVFPI